MIYYVFLYVYTFSGKRSEVGVSVWKSFFGEKLVLDYALERSFFDFPSFKRKEKVKYRIRKIKKIRNKVVMRK